MSAQNSHAHASTSSLPSRADGPSVVYRSKPSDSKVIMRCLGSTAIVLVAFVVLYRGGQSLMGFGEATCFVTSLVAIALYVVAAFTLRENKKGQDFGWVDDYKVDLNRFSEKPRQFIAAMQMPLGPGRFVACSLLEACIFMDFLQPSSTPRDPIAAMGPPSTQDDTTSQSPVEVTTDWDAEEESTEGLASARFLNMYKQQEAAASSE